MNACDRVREIESCLLWLSLFGLLLEILKLSGGFHVAGDLNIAGFYRYLKSVFPKAEETLLLDILANADNNVQKATEKLMLMGFEKRDTPPPRLTLRRREEEQKEQERRTATPTPPPRMKSTEEKQKSKFPYRVIVVFWEF
ncbi:hypothetical protein PR048_021989 [Dryococelus australis]|uniref:CUE domain-containing protein n=1 Tax=Dryococelus australis TaxID=614101 RepID=A0ABQ9GZR7_9NEOP|nr:hypothetical protein PR048_021989 [Dryococelus australis]